MEFKLYKTKLKLSSLLSSSHSVQSTPPSFYVLTYQLNSSLWFNRSNGDIQFKKSK
jgi:hypothetical protein